MQGASCSEKAGSHPHNKVGRERLYTDISVYTGVIKLWRDKFTALGLDDIDYTKYDDILQRKPIDELDRDEVIAYLVMLTRWRAAKQKPSACACTKQ